ncbi:MAG: hypothetical protein HY717_07995 [Planctomycetes bacterium]|nr:hypothetical protein [Planctomycetota bacterium]
MIQGSNNSNPSKSLSPTLPLLMLGALGLLNLAAPATARAQAPAVRLNPGKGERLGPELAKDQKEVRELLQEVRRQIEHLADELKARQPEDAKRLLEATDKIQKLQLENGLTDLVKIFGESNLLISLETQERVIKNIQEIIEILEARKFQEKDLENQLQKLGDSRREVGQLRREQETLLKKAEDFLKNLAGLNALRDLKSRLDALTRMQSALFSPLDPPEGTVSQPGSTQNEPSAGENSLSKEDSQALDRALEEVKKLEAAHAAFEQKARQPSESPEGPKTASPPPEELAGMEKWLRSLVSLEGAAKRLLENTRHAAGVAADSSKELSSQEAGKAEKAQAGNQGEAPKAEEGKAASPEKTAEGKKPVQGPNEGPAEKSPEVAPPSSQASPKTAAGKGSKEESPAGKAKEGGSIPDLRSQADELSKGIRQLQEETQKAGGPQSAPAADLEAAKEEVDRAKEKLSAGTAAEKPSSAGAREAIPHEEKAVNALAKARERLAAAMAPAKNQSAKENEALARQAGELKEAMAQASQDMGNQARKAGSPKAESGLEKGSQSTASAAGSMEQAKEALEQGNRSQAASQSQAAGKNLAAARQALEQAKAALASRSETEKKADLERKLSKKAEELKKETEELARKLRPKNQPAEAPLPADKAASELGGAAKAMEEAARERQGGGQSAGEREKESLERLNKAKKALDDQEKDLLARLEREPLKKQAREQDRLERMTRETAKKMAQETGGPERMKQDSQSLEEAAGDMQEAEQSLDQEEAQKAKEKEEEALAKLKRAEGDLREEEERLARLKQEEHILKVAKEIEEVKTSQESINAGIRDLEAKRGGSGGKRHPRAAQIQIKKHASEEEELAKRVEAVTEKLEEEISRVFAYVLRNVDADMKSMAEALNDHDTGGSTQFLGDEVVRELERLLQSMRETIERQQQQSGKPQQKRPPQPRQRRLVSRVTELIMLKEMQVEVNRRTRDLEASRQAGASGELWEKALQRLGQKQGSLTEMTKKIAKDVEGEPEEPDEPERKSGPEMKRGEAGGEEKGAGN